MTSWKPPFMAIEIVEHRNHPLCLSQMVGLEPHLDRFLWLPNPTLTTIVIPWGRTTIVLWDDVRGHRNSLVGGWATPLKNMSSSVGMMKATQYFWEHKIDVPNHQPVVDWPIKIGGKNPPLAWTKGARTSIPIPGIVKCHRSRGWRWKHLENLWNMWKIIENRWKIGNLWKIDGKCEIYGKWMKD